MKIRFSAALLIAALSITILSGCAAVSATPAPSQPLLTAVEEPLVPLAPTPQPVVPVPTEAPTVPAPTVPAPTVPVPTAPAPTAPVSETAASSRITKDEAIAIALKDAGLTRDQVAGLRAEFDYDDGRPEYDVDFRQGNYEYDYEIHAESGKILSRDKDWDD
jgi:hypothetical protein